MKKIIIYTVVALLSLLYIQSATAQDTIVTFESDYNFISDMIATQDGNLLLVTNNYVKKVTTEGEELWSFESNYHTYCKKIIERQNGNFLVALDEDNANICELDINTGELVSKCILTHPDHAVNSYLYDYVEMPDQSVFAIWKPYGSYIAPYIVKIDEDLTDYSFITQSNVLLVDIASINETQIMCTSFSDEGAIIESGTRVYNVSGEIVSENIYNEELIPICLTRLDNSRLISLNRNFPENNGALLFCNEMGEVLKNIKIDKFCFNGDIAINEEDQLIYIAIQSSSKKDCSTSKATNRSIWSVNFEGEIIDSMFFMYSSEGIGIAYYEDYVYNFFGGDPSQYLVKIPKSELLSIKDPKILEANTYPNPAQDVVYFMWETQKLERGKIDIIDLQGKVVASVSIENNSAAWQCANFANGVYLYRITDSGKTVGGGKVVVRH